MMNSNHAATPKVYRPCSRQTLKKLNTANFEVVTQSIKDTMCALKQQQIQFSLQLDMWTKHGESFAAMNMTFVSPEDAQTKQLVKPDVHEICIAFTPFGNERHTGEHIKNWILSVKRKFGFDWDDVSQIVADGAANCQKAISLLRLEVGSGRIQSRPCYAHNLQRACAHATGFGGAACPEDLERVHKALEKSRKIAAKVHASPLLGARLRQLQKVTLLSFSLIIWDT